MAESVMTAQITSALNKVEFTCIYKIAFSISYILKTMDRERRNLLNFYRICYGV